MTSRAVVDTNVLVAANGRDTHVDGACRIACVDELDRLCAEEVVCVDDKYLILGEYQRRVADMGPALPGTVFFKTIFKNMHNERRIRTVPVEPLDAEGREFSEPRLQPNNLKKDAKFLAVAFKANAAIVNASDSDWEEHRDLTARLGVDVRQLCPQHANRAKPARGNHASR